MKHPPATPAELSRYRRAFEARGGLKGPTRPRESCWAETCAGGIVFGDDTPRRAVRLMPFATAAEANTNRRVVRIGSARSPLPAKPRGRRRQRAA